MTKHGMQKQKGKGKKGAHTATAPKPRATSYSNSPIRTPTGMNDLPDELLDDIALFAEKRDLPALALVEQRWYAPARRQAIFKVVGFDSAMCFAEVLLGGPSLGKLVRELRLYVADAPLGFADPGPPLVCRAMAIIIDECPYVHQLGVYHLPQAPRTHIALLEAVGQLEHLRGLNLRGQVSARLLGVLSPAFTSLQSLALPLGFFSADDVLPPLPECHIPSIELTLCFYTASQLQDILASFAVMQPRSFRVTTAVVEDSIPPSFAEIGPFLPLRTDINLALHIVATGPHITADWSNIELEPEDVGWWHLTHGAHPAGSGILNLASAAILNRCFHVGDWQYGRPALAKLVKDVGSRLRPEAVEAHRGRRWSDADVSDLESLVRALGAEVKWR